MLNPLLFALLLLALSWEGHANSIDPSSFKAPRSGGELGLNRPPPLRPPHHPPQYGYDRHHLPQDVRYEVIRGISYAVLDDFYYQRQGNNYLFVAAPPSADKITVNTGGFGQRQDSAAGGGQLGKLIEQLPSNYQKVTIDGVEFAVAAGVWYAPIAGSDSYVIVPAQL